MGVRGDLNTSQTGGLNSRGDAITDRVVETSIVRVLTNKFGLSERVVQAIQELAGLRGQPDGTRPREAVRHEDLASIARMSEMKSKQVSGPPTVADFNALRDDVRMLFEAMRVIAQRL
ncbi:hypothetical protein [Burkholderia multivorans]|uniref:hypothetical protein n=1 Tax=Burkholderia multivorans TaxID=87883 RepID=UPI001C23A067|nr:hypothetical protein [Burkholderia multivorans]ULR75134.1 hypothetical protein JC1_62 [Burkholderia phage JC1]MBU9386648.1 hypothetical protein [Burkholderia multivorans]MBU9437082.1 hypothetical protein [Burkholderia multivorans]MBU9606287.1 hypothetical protein [Burkholderia multivorans]MBU9624846.1 hypothetical protein [Burkholderia multivorans]